MTKLVFNGILDGFKPFIFKIIEYKNKNGMVAAFDFVSMAWKVYITFVKAIVYGLP